MSSLLPLVIVVLLVAVPVMLVGAHAAIGEPRVTDWARAHGLELTADNRPLVADYLRRARVLRSWGAVSGPAPADPRRTRRRRPLRGRRFSSDGWVAPFQGPMTVFVGYLVGALCAELTVARRVESASRSASLVPRALADYLPRRLVSEQRALGCAVALGVLALGAVPYEPSVTPPTWLGLLTLACVFAGFAVVLEALERWLVRRPQPFTDASRVAADDAIRAQSVDALAGSGLALLWISLSGVSVGIAASGVPLLIWTTGPLAAIAFALSIRAAMEIADRPWRVRRPIAHSTGAAPT